MRIMTTILVCVVTVLTVVVIVIERRVRHLSHHGGYTAQAIVPGTYVILPSKLYTLFRLPPDLPRGGIGHLVLSGTGSSTEDTDVSLTLHGASRHGIHLYAAEGVKTFELDTVLEFEIDDHGYGAVIALRMDSSNPGPHMIMSDIIATLIVR